MITLRFWIFRFCFLSWNIGLAVFGLWILAFPRPYVQRFVRFYLSGTAFIMKYIGGTDFRVIGIENLPATPCIIAAKHLAPWETMVLPLLGRSPAIVLKKELMKLPLWGWYAAKYGNVPVDRSAGAKAMLQMLGEAKKVIKAGRDVMIFPQGTRLELGEWKPYKIGVAAMYSALNVPVLPVAINSGIFWSRSGKLRRTGTITVEFLSPLPTGLHRNDMIAQLQNVIEAATNRLVMAEGGPTVIIPPDAKPE
jgi:1-acyl-sn-glycerol-3-phosphate acyltransferase